MAGFSNLNETMPAVQEAAADGLNSMAHVIEVFSDHHQQNPCETDYKEMTNFTVSKFKRVISLLDRTGHARFRRSPVQPRHISPVQQHNVKLAYGLTQPQNPASKVYKPQPQSNVLSLSPAAPQAPAAAQPLMFGNSNKPGAPFKKYGTLPTVLTTSNSTYMSSVTGERSFSNRRGRLPFMCGLQSAQAVSGGKPPLPVRRNREDDRSGDPRGQTSVSRTGKSKRRIRKIIKVPAISSNNKDIPPDQYSWRKYGEREIKGSPYPRCYYKCRMMKDRACPARKYVERDVDDPRMLFVIYEGEHCHNQSAMQEIAAAGGGDPERLVVNID